MLHSYLVMFWGKSKQAFSFAEKHFAAMRPVKNYASGHKVDY